MIALRPKKPFYDYGEDYEKYGIPMIRLNIGSDTYNFLIDTGASFTLIGDEIIDKYRNDFVMTDLQANLSGIDGKDVESNYVYTSVCIEDIEVELPGIIYSSENLKAMYEEVVLHGLLGYDFLERNKIKIDTENKKLLI
jgi:predicted aspartyl protease